VTDDELIARFEDCSLPNECFHHADHVRTAFIYLTRYSVMEALQRFSTSLLRFATKHGKPDRYNETITWAYIFLIRERMTRSEGGQTWPEFARHNPDLLDWNNNTLKKYYREETLASPLAKSTFLMPDRIA
jgi:hypothetical protein